MSQEEVLYGDDMTKVEDMGGDNVPAKRWYHIRVSKVVTHDADGKQKLSSTGNPTAQINLAIQDEEFAGRNITQIASLQPHALAWLKAMYVACEVPISSAGHNPHKLLDRECYVKPEEDIYEGVKRLKIAPWNIKPLSEGRPLK